MEARLGWRLSCLAALVMLFSHLAFADSRPPNVVFILADDLG